MQLRRVRYVMEGKDWRRGGVFEALHDEREGAMWWKEDVKMLPDPCVAIRPLAFHSNTARRL